MSLDLMILKFFKKFPDGEFIGKERTEGHLYHNMFLLLCPLLPFL